MYFKFVWSTYIFWISKSCLFCDAYIFVSFIKFFVYCIHYVCEQKHTCFKYDQTRFTDAFNVVLRQKVVYATEHDYFFWLSGFYISCFWALVYKHQVLASMFCIWQLFKWSLQDLTYVLVRLQSQIGV